VKTPAQKSQKKNGGKTFKKGKVLARRERQETMARETKRACENRAG
jgi:hypothetical protein